MVEKSEDGIYFTKFMVRIEVAVHLRQYGREDGIYFTKPMVRIEVAVHLRQYGLWKTASILLSSATAR